MNHGIRVQAPGEAKALVIKTKLENPGLKTEEVAARCGVPVRTAAVWLRSVELVKKADDIKEFVEKAVFEDKVPVIRAIGDAGLVALFEWLAAFVGEEKHLALDVKEAKDLTNLITSLHSMYRLELGKSTSNLSFMIEKTERNINVILSNLQRPPEEGGDPFGLLPKTIDVKPD